MASKRIILEKKRYLCEAKVTEKEERGSDFIRTSKTSTTNKK